MHLFSLTCLSLATMAAPLWAQDIKQDINKDDAIIIRENPEAVQSITHFGKGKRYKDSMLTRGVIFETGTEFENAATIKHGNSVAGALLHLRGQGTHMRYKGHWQGDVSSAYPMLILNDGAKLTWEKEAHVDFVLADSFFTRQLWAWGDGTGVLEIAEDFVADRTQGGTVPDAMGTVRMAGLTLITHHSQSLPYNARPDGRGGIYHNGHVVFEGTIPSTWIVATNPHTYAAQIDFGASGTIECQAALTHTGRRRDCLQVGPGGHFVSTGAFRTTKPDATITKTGPAMLSLDGQQGYYPNSTLVIAEGLLRMHTDPAAGDFYDDQAGNHLHLVVKAGARAYLGAPTIRLQKLTVEAGATLDIGKNTKVVVSGETSIASDAVVNNEGGSLE